MTEAGKTGASGPVNVVESGEDVRLTRHGRPARRTPVPAAPKTDERLKSAREPTFPVKAVFSRRRPCGRRTQYP